MKTTTKTRKVSKQQQKLIDQQLAFALATVDFTGTWKHVPENTQYIALDDGRVWSVKRKKFLALSKHMSGYQLVCRMTFNGHHRLRTLHEIIAHTFLGPKPEGMEVNHINSIKTDNRVHNLEYVTRAQNMQKAWDAGLMENVKTIPRPFGSEHYNSILTESDIPNILEMKNNKVKYKKIAEIYNVAPTTIRSIFTGRCWSHITGFEKKMDKRSA